MARFPAHQRNSALLNLGNNSLVPEWEVKGETRKRKQLSEEYGFVNRALHKKKGAEQAQKHTQHCFVSSCVFATVLTTIASCSSTAPCT